MRTTPLISHSACVAGTSVTSLVDQLLLPASVLAHQSRSVLTNDIEPAFFTAAPAARIQPVLEAILDALLLCARQGRIFITAERVGENIQVIFEERNNYNGYALAFRLCSVEPLAREAGGHLSVRGEKSLQVRICFSFPDSERLPVSDWTSNDID